MRISTERRDAHTGMVVGVNPFVLRLLGNSYDDVYGKHLWDIGSFKDISSSKEAFRPLQDNEYIRYEDLPQHPGIQGETLYQHL